MLGIDKYEADMYRRAFAKKNEEKIMVFITKLVEHQDGQAFSFIIPLNKDYVGGGTKFKFLEDIIDPDIGNCTIFCGKHHHKGIEIKTGERYILAGFLSYGFDYQNI